jgi:DNA invertase Pin-like site-specific DNA recombinase
VQNAVDEVCNDKPLIAYIRVSTSQQGRSGLGIEAQRETLRHFADAEGFEITREFVEVETGRGADTTDPVCRHWSAVKVDDATEG